MSAPRSRSGEPGGVPAALIVVVAAALVLRLVVGGLTHLTEDEAYYRLWSMAPAFGYYDHPPMVAWWIWLGRQVAGDTALGVRLLPILATAATSFIAFDLARLAGASRATAQRAGIWFNATILVLAGGFLAAPDAPASLFWALTLDAALRALAARRIEWWAAAGLAAGLACLAKYSALFIAPGMVFWLAASGQGRAALRTPGPWLAALIAVVVFAGNIVWNADHQWLTIVKQFGRIAPHQFAPRYLIELFVGQFLLLNPFVALFALAPLVARPRPARANLAPFVLTCAPFALYLVIHSLHDRVQAHWPAPLYPSIAICAAVGSERLSQHWRLISKLTAPVGFAIGAILLVLLLAPGSLLGHYDLALPVRGWSAFGDRLEALRRVNGAAWVGTSSYGLAAELADTPQVGAPVIQMAERDRWSTLKFAAAPPMSSPGLAVDLTRRLTSAGLSRCFAKVIPLGVLVRGDPGEPGKAYAVFKVAGPRRDILAVGC